MMVVFSAGAVNKYFLGIYVAINFPEISMAINFPRIFWAKNFPEIYGSGAE